jgi:hypothetical protein
VLHYERESWDEFATPGAPRIEFVLALRDHAAREATA